MKKEEKKRSEISEEYKWDLSDLYKNDDEYNKDYESLKKEVEKLKTYKGIITKDDTTLLEFLKLNTRVDVLITNLYVYANVKKDEDVENKENQKRFNDILNYYSYVSEICSFITPELLKTDYKTIKEYINNNSKLKEYEFSLEQIYKYQPYTLDETNEKLLSYLNDLQQKYENSTTLILNSIMDYGYIKDEDGIEVKLTNGNYSKYIKSENRTVRKDAFLARYNTIKKYASLLSINYEGHVKADGLIAKSRGYDNSIHMYLFPDGVTEEIYDNLLSVADKNKKVLHKYFKMIKDILKLDDFSVYDISAPICKSSNKKYTKDDAKNIIVSALSIYGNEYKKVLEEAFDNRWIDFYPNKGKTSGYYQIDSYKGHPLILGNFNDDLSSVSAIAHELGHAVHSYFSNKYRSVIDNKYPLILAEVASLTNEMILSNYIVNNSNDKEEKLAAISNILEVFSNNFYGTLKEGSIFERKVHKLIDEGNSLTDSDFNEIFKDIVDDYYGNDVNEKDKMKYNWARVPHFYESFYYYKYSIGVVSACYIAKRILNEDKEYLQKYLNYLKLGGSMMPLDALKTIDLDFSNTKVLEEAISYFDELIDTYINIYKEV